ncbi:hypothetical protein [Paraburkholderia diazotrophica]|uniref:hypothetical protein n=1 Tax=Paraburkholderia diazotrophica TaxID=667676 RepID=UPI003D182FAE
MPNKIIRRLRYPRLGHGETDAGKEHIAQLQVHERHLRYGEGPYIAVNGGAISGGLFDSLLWRCRRIRDTVGARAGRRRQEREPEGVHRVRRGRLRLATLPDPGTGVADAFAYTYFPSNVRKLRNLAEWIGTSMRQIGAWDAARLRRLLTIACSANPYPTRVRRACSSTAANGTWPNAAA